MSNDEQILRNVVAFWGTDSQLDMVQEELAECIVAISHLRRGRIGQERLAEEMADVLLCFDQLKVMFDGLVDQIDLEYHNKLYRLRNRLDWAEARALQEVSP